MAGLTSPKRHVLSVLTSIGASRDSHACVNWGISLQVRVAGPSLRSNHS